MGVLIAKHTIVEDPQIMRVTFLPYIAELGLLGAQRDILSIGVRLIPVIDGLSHHRVELLHPR